MTKGITALVLLGTTAATLRADVEISFTRPGGAALDGVERTEVTTGVELWMTNKDPTTTALSAYQLRFDGGDFSSEVLCASNWSLSSAFDGLVPEWLSVDEALDSCNADTEVSGVTGSLSPPFVGPTLPVDVPVLIATFDLQVNAPDPILAVDLLLDPTSGIDDQDGNLAGAGISDFGATIPIAVDLVVDVALRAVDVDNPTAPEEGALPEGLIEVCPNDEFILEIWVSQIDGAAQGIAGGSVDLHYDNSLLSAGSIDHGSIYDGDLNSGTIDDDAGLVDDVGGATVEAGHGVAGNWALLARVRMTTADEGEAQFWLAHGAFRFALAGGEAPVPDKTVDVSETLTLTVADSLPPAPVNCPADQTAECDGTDGLGPVALDELTAEDNCDPAPAITCLDQADQPVQTGDRVENATVITCTVSDASGNSSSCTAFTVSVEDTTTPTLVDCPEDQTAECDGTDGLATLSFSAPTAEDSCDADPVVDCRDQGDNPIQAGDRVPDGTIITCSAADASANQASCAPITVTVEDTTGPGLTACPTDQTVECDGSDGKGELVFTPPGATDGCDETPVVECRDEGGGLVESGDRVADGTVITCTATDIAGNASSCPSFTVTVGQCTCLYDLDVNGVIDLGDFALFAPHYATFTGDTEYTDCADFYYDGVIEPADVSFFGTAIGKDCFDPTIVFPDSEHLPPDPCPVIPAGAFGGEKSTGPTAGAVTDQPVRLDVRTVVLPSASPAGAAQRLPRSWLSGFDVRQEFVIEVWARMSDNALTGLTGGTVNVRVDPVHAAILNASVDPKFRVLATGDVDRASGVVSGLGGATLRKAEAVSEWVRFATIECRAVATGVLSISLETGCMDFAQYASGNITGDAVTVSGSRTRICREPARRAPSGLGRRGKD